MHKSKKESGFQRTQPLSFQMLSVAPSSKRPKLCNKKKRSKTIHHGLHFIEFFVRPSPRVPQLLEISKDGQLKSAKDAVKQMELLHRKFQQTSFVQSILLRARRPLPPLPPGSRAPAEAYCRWTQLRTSGIPPPPHKHPVLLVYEYDRTARVRGQSLPLVVRTLEVCPPRSDRRGARAPRCSFAPA